MDYYYNGYRIIISEALTKYKRIRLRMHKSKRIDKKWLKVYGYKNIPLVSDMIVFEDNIFMNKVTFDKFTEALEKEKGER